MKVAKAGEKMKIRHNLRVMMAKKRVRSIKELSELTGIKYQHLINFNRYKQKQIDPVLVTTLCEFFGCKLQDFIYIYRGQDGTDDGFPREKNVS